MNASTDVKKAQELTLAQTVLGLRRHYLGGRKGIIALALATAGSGLYLGWGWLTAVGIAPILLALAPCAAMCALGLCMNKGGGKSCSPGSQQAAGKDEK